MDALRIDTLEARYHLPVGRAGKPADGATRARLDGVLREALETAAAVVQRDLPAEELILVRELRVPVRLDLAAGDTALGLAWGDAFAEVLAALLDEADPDAVVRYRNRREALVDCARGVARGDLHRAWAWRQLGLLSVEGERSVGVAAMDLARALAADPPAIVTVLAVISAPGGSERRLGKEKDLPWLLGRWPASVLLELAELALEAAGVPAECLVAGGAGRERGAGELQAGVSRSAAGPELEALPQVALSRLARALERSRIATAVRGLRAGDPASRAVAALALLESDPGLLRGSAAGAVLAAAEQAMAADSRPISTPSPSQAMTPPSAATEARPADPLEAAPAATLPGNDSTSPAERQTGHTQWGGLLFLLHLVVELNLPEEIAASEDLAARSLRWTLHRLAIHLLGRAGEEEPAEDDPAALAFAGLPPDAEPPSNDEPPASSQEEAALAVWAERLLFALAHPHSHPPGEGAPPPGPRRTGLATEGPDCVPPLPLCGRGGQGVRVLRRQARILADPGWIEVHFSLDDVALDLRRAGLDLDPGWLPWLGAVMRFVYG
jgi:hypothetical protein